MSEDRYDFANDTKQEEMISPQKTMLQQIVARLLADRRTMMIFVFFSVFSVVYTVIGALDKSSDDQIQSVPDTAVSAPVHHAAAPVVAAPAATPTDDRMVDSKISQAQQGQNAKIHELSSSIEDLQQMKEHLTHDIDVLNYRLDSIVDTMSKMSQQVTDVNQYVNAQKTQAVAAAKSKQKAVVANAYHVEGMIEGRAWIVDQNGRNYSVTVGDALKDVGFVSGIFVDEGYVTTSSGTVIQFQTGL